MYKVKGVGTAHSITSKVKIFTEGEKIKKVVDRWDDELPEGTFKNVSVLSLRSLPYYCHSRLYWGWHFCWETLWWRVGGSYCQTSVAVADDSCRSCIHEADFSVSYRLPGI